MSEVPLYVPCSRDSCSRVVADGHGVLPPEEVLLNQPTLPHPAISAYKTVNSAYKTVNIRQSRPDFGL